MFKRLLPTLCLLLPLTAALAQEEPAPAAETETVLLVGQRPGPGLWKVSKGDHTLWVFGTYSPLPDKLEWRSQEVEKVLAQSQEYLAPPRAQFKIGFFKSLTMLPTLIGLEKNPDGATLKDVLPAEVYARWQPLKDKYLGKNSGVERERPIFVAQKLYEAALKQSGLTRGAAVDKKIDGIVKQHDIKVTETGIKLDTSNASEALSDFKKSQLADTACFTKTLDRLESDLDAMRVRANAWAKGDIDAIQKLSFPDQKAACDDAMLNAEFVKKQPALQNVKERVQTAWVAAAEKALEHNTSSFAMLSMTDILGGNSYLNALKAKGYEVTSPD
ncbi:TraB/GumN family protein [Duganella sp. FT94W]|uniref:TraB/GumN family protein n=1 Tax=Duganella lactea TaxID=2692173 RepID=A0ABW9V638_9BURK|nr:TraB/GumN family protein [Duganella lactea]MYM35134.1 TraB/GumN family protein [Duganella lactea]